MSPVIGNWEWTELAVACMSIFGGSFVLGTAGFGMGLTAVPLMLTLIDPVTVVVCMNTVALLMYSLVLLQTKEHLQLRKMAPITVAGMLAVPLAIYFLNSFNGTLLRIIISLIILISAIAFCFNIQRALPRENVIAPVFGFAVGLMLVTLGTGGPLLVLFLFTQGTSKQAFRASMAFYFFGVDIVGILGYTVTGMFTLDRILLVLTMLIPVLGGFWVSKKIVNRLNEVTFKYIVTSVIIVGSLVVIGREAF